MKLEINESGKLIVDDCKIVFRNFSGEKGPYNPEGNRNFALVIETEEMARALLDQGWNVKIKEPNEEGDTPFMYLPVKVHFGSFPPNIYLKTGANKILLDEDNVSCLDRISMERIDMDIRPYDWEWNGESGRKAYLEAMCVTQHVDRFASVDEESSEDGELPF